jgi:hypothetical protein
MPPGRDAVVTVGISVTTILRLLVLFPAEFVALTVKLDVPVAVGVPDITPLVVLKFKPAGSVPLDIAHVFGVVPVAISLWL